MTKEKVVVDETMVKFSVVIKGNNYTRRDVRDVGCVSTWIGEVEASGIDEIRPLASGGVITNRPLLSNCNIDQVWFFLLYPILDSLYIDICQYSTSS